MFTCTVKSRDGYSSPRAKISMHNLTVTVCAQNSALKNMSLKATNANIYENNSDFKLVGGARKARKWRHQRMMAKKTDLTLLAQAQHHRERT